jgi:GDPmannose 4,6-dehydratase
VFASSCILYSHESPRRPESFVTRKITRAAARISLGLDDTVQLGNLDAKRDWGWAPDYVDAMHLAATASRPGDFVLATGVAHSVADFARLAFARVGIADWRSRVELSSDLARPADPSIQVGNPERARRELGWTASRSFEAVVAAMVDADLERESAS